jgi:hypothetical protein
MSVLVNSRSLSASHLHNKSQLVSTMSRHFPLITPHNCWFCSQSNPSYLRLCNSCGGATVPTRDKSRKKHEWTVFSFCSNVLGSRHHSSFPDAIEAFNTQDKIAIRLTDGHTKHIIVRHMHNEAAFYSVRKKNGEVMTMGWNEATEEDQMLFCRLENMAGESNLSH